MPIGLVRKPPFGLGQLAGSLAFPLAFPEGGTPPDPDAPMRALYADGTPGGWWDPSDMTTLFQDAAGTTPVTAVEQPVGLIRDKSGRGNHLQQPNTPSRPLLKRDGTGRLYLQFDGFDDSLYTVDPVILSAADKLVAAAGCTNAAGTSFGPVFETSINSDNNAGSFLMFTNNGLGFSGIANGGGQRTGRSIKVNAGVLSEIIYSFDLAGTSLAARCIQELNGAVVSGNTEQNQTTSGNFQAFRLYVGRRNNVDFPAQFNVYQKLIYGKTPDATGMTTLRNQIHSKTGAY